MEMASQLDARKAEIKALWDELEECKRQLSKSQAEVQSVHARFTDADIKSQSQREKKEKRAEKRREESKSKRISRPQSPTHKEPLFGHQRIQKLPCMPFRKPIPIWKRVTLK